MLVAVVPFPAFSQSGHYWIDIQLEPDVYVLRGETLSITVNGNFSSCTVEFWFGGELFASYNHAANTTRQFTIQQAYPYGTYTVKAVAGETEVSTWLTVLKIDDWQPARFPYERSHNGVDYTFFANGSIKAENSQDEMFIDLSTLRTLVNLYDLDVTATYNSMNFRVNFQKPGIANVNFVFSFVHTGCKFIVEGELDEARDFRFNIKNPIRLKKLVDSVKQGNLIFDYSDLKRAAHVFSYSNGVLTLSLPKTFSFDPTIFATGFEDGSGYDEWDSTTTSGSSTFAINQTIVYAGVNSSKHVGDNAGGNAYLQEDIAFSSYPYFYYEAQIYFEDLGDGGSCFLFGPYRFSTGAGVFKLNNNKIYFHWKETDWTEHNVEVFTPSTGQWYTLGAAIYSNAAGNYTVWLDGAENVSDTGVDMVPGGQIPNRFYCGLYLEFAGPTVFYDDVLVTDEIPTGGEEGQDVTVELSESASVDASLLFWKELLFSSAASASVDSGLVYRKELQVLCGEESTSISSESVFMKEKLAVLGESTSMVLETVYRKELLVSYGETVTLQIETETHTEAGITLSEVIIETVGGAASSFLGLELGLRFSEGIVGLAELYSSSEIALDFFEFLEPIAISAVLHELFEVLSLDELDVAQVALAIALIASCVATLAFALYASDRREQ